MRRSRDRLVADATAGKAKYKARALDYFRYHVSLGVYDWILHMYVVRSLTTRESC